ncbi:hypothetical protein AB1K32_15215 [Metabacillus dongyingensis]|uniref:hypothetical protein n=1 Tax=Metabacillus dongyingensis TaxID=2874282 RepID=UPI003B8C01DA
MSVNDMKIKALTNRIAGLRQKQNEYQKNDDHVLVAMAEFTIMIYTRDLQDLIEEGEAV